MKSPNIKVIKNSSRGESNSNWLIARFSFSFGNYYNPERVGFACLRVLNNDIISPKSGFDFHPHQNMEIVTIPLSGELTHEDNLGNRAVISKGFAQSMSAGTGIIHSEKNLSSKNTELFQLWFLPQTQGSTPKYQDKNFHWQNTQEEWINIISPSLFPQKDSLQVNQSVFIVIGNFTQKTEYITFFKNRSVYLIVIEGLIKIDNQTLTTKDAISFNQVNNIDIEVIEKSSIMVIEMEEVKN